MKKIAVIILLFNFSISMTAQQTAIVRGSNVNVRTCPNLQCQVLFKVNSGLKCILLSVGVEEHILGYGINNWYQVKVNKKNGYIYGAFLDLIPKNPIIAANHNANQQVKVRGDSVNVRSCGDIFCPQLFKVNTGNRLKVLAKTKNSFIAGLGSFPWYKVNYNGKEGFIYGAFVDCRNCNFKTTSNSNNEMAVITGDNVNIRKQIGLQTPIDFTLNIGDKCKVLKEYSAVSIAGLGTYPWYKIEYNGKEGYIFGKFLSIEEKALNKLKVWAVIVGISDYSVAMNRKGATDLRYSDEDAKRIYQFLKSPKGGNVPETQIKLIRNQEATKQHILATTKQLFSTATEDDLIIFYFSGHGGPNYFVTHNDYLKHDDLKQLIESSIAKKKLCVADACYSGTWSNNTMAQKSQQNLNSSQLSRLYYNTLSNAGNGIALFMSSNKNEISMESSSLRQGIFTYYYIEGLKGKADANNDQITTIQELYNYVKRMVSQYAWNNFQHRQTPQLNGYFDANMPIGVTQ